MDESIHWQIAQAADKLITGGVIAYPTETIYGMGCDPRSETALNKLLKIKQRNINKGFILLAGEAEHLHFWLEDKWISWINQQPQTPITTWVVPCKKETLSELKGEHESLAVRLSSHPIVKSLCAITGAITSTSINLINQDPINDYSKIKQNFLQDLEWVIPDEDIEQSKRLNAKNKSSRIVDAVSGKILRQ